MKYRENYHPESFGLSFIKFKEFYYDKEKKDYCPTQGNNYHLINLSKVDSFIVSLDDGFIAINGMVGKFVDEI